MEACHKDKQSHLSSVGEMSWPEWILAMQENSRLLRELLEAAEWEPLQRAILHRESLLRRAAERLSLSPRNRPSSSSTKGDSDIKMALQAALNTNRDIMGILQNRCRELKAKIGDMSKGRKLLNLYKTHRQAAPRFFDRLG